MIYSRGREESSGLSTSASLSHKTLKTKPTGKKLREKKYLSCLQMCNSEQKIKKKKSASSVVGRQSQTEYMEKDGICVRRVKVPSHRANCKGSSLCVSALESIM